MQNILRYQSWIRPVTICVAEDILISMEGEFP